MYASNKFHSIIRENVFESANIRCMRLNIPHNGSVEMNSA